LPAADEEIMQERRLEPRLLCADLIDVWWVDAAGQTHKALANLEDISNSGVCLQVDSPVPFETLLHIGHPKMIFEGRVRYCVFRDTGYFVGVRFEPGFHWDRHRFRPKHLLDPRTLLARTRKSKPRPHLVQ
jgi:hypothetical protein